MFSTRTIPAPAQSYFQKLPGVFCPLVLGSITAWLSAKMSAVYTNLWEEKKDERICKTVSTHKLQMPLLHLQNFKAQVWTPVCQHQSHHCQIQSVQLPYSVCCYTGSSSVSLVIALCYWHLLFHSDLLCPLQSCCLPEFFSLFHGKDVSVVPRHMTLYLYASIFSQSWASSVNLWLWARWEHGMDQTFIDWEKNKNQF